MLSATLSAGNPGTLKANAVQIKDIPPEPMRPAHECLEQSSGAGKFLDTEGTCPWWRKTAKAF